MSIKLMQLVWDADVPQSRKLVLLSLADQANDAGECYPSISTIERRCSMGRRTVFSALADLEEAGFLSREELSKQRVLFRIDATRLSQLSLTGCQISTSAKSAPVQNRHQCEIGTGAADAPTSAKSAPDQCQIGTGPVPNRHPYKATPIEPSGNPQEPSDDGDGAPRRKPAAGDAEPLTAGRVMSTLRQQNRAIRGTSMNPDLIAAVEAGTPLEYFQATAEGYPDKPVGYIAKAALSQYLAGLAPAPTAKRGTGGKPSPEALQQHNQSVAAEWLAEQS
jgi:hypothetical protein